MRFLVRCMMFGMLFLGITQFAQAQTLDTLRVQTLADTLKKISILDTAKKKPKTPAQIAFRRSLMLPGAGQVYNKQKWLVPIICAGAVTSGGFIAWFGARYKIYRDAYIDASTNKKSVTITDLRITKEGIIREQKGPYSAEQLRYAKNQARRNRDLNYIGLALGWGLQAVQANVQAHLRTFDSDNNISLKIEPMIDEGMVGVGLVFRFE